MLSSSDLTKQNPWPGLRAFGEDDRDFFFGREREATELFGLVQRAGGRALRAVGIGQDIAAASRFISKAEGARLLSCARSLRSR